MQSTTNNNKFICTQNTEQDECPLFSELALHKTFNVQVILIIKILSYAFYMNTKQMV